MRKVRLNALAESDLLDIWAYSFEQWDAVQADKYLDEIEAALHSLAENPELGLKRDYVRAGYRVLIVNRHAIYYTVGIDTIHIIRVLHGQMDPDKHL